MQEEPALTGWIHEGGPEPATGGPEPVLESTSTPGWQSATGGPEPVLATTSAVDQELVGSGRVPGRVSSLGRARDSAQGLQGRQVLYNMEMRHGRLQSQPQIDSRSAIAHATESVANIGDFATMTDVADVSGGAWNKPSVRDDLPVAAGAPVVHGGCHGTGAADWSEPQFATNVAQLQREQQARANMASSHALGAALAAAVDRQARMPPTPPETPTPAELSKIKKDAIKDFIIGIAQMGWKRWTQNQIKAIQEKKKLPRMGGRRRMRYFLAVAEMVQTVAHGAARGKEVELHPENDAMKAAGAKQKLLNEANGLQSLMDAMKEALETAWPAQQADGCCGGVGKEDILLLGRTALQWSLSGQDAAKPWDTAFAAVELGRATTSTQLPGTAGWCYEWHIRWDVGRNVVHIVPTELPSNLPNALLGVTQATFTCSTMGLDGLSHQHMKPLHLHPAPDASGVWRTQNVPVVPGGPPVECWRALPQWRDTVNTLKSCAQRQQEKRQLPEGPDPTARWVIEEKMNKALSVQRMLEGEESLAITKEMIDETLADPTVKLTQEDYELLTHQRPDLLEMLTRVTMDGAPWTVVDMDVQLSDSVDARMNVKKQKLADKKAGRR